jgi:hypothetical protein
MASAMYPTGKKKVFDNDDDLVTDASVKLVPVKSTYTYAAAHDFMDDVTVIAATGFAGAFGQADRLVPASRASTVAGSIVEFTFNSPTWSAIGNGTNDTVGGIVLMNETGQTMDTTTPIFCFDDLVGNVTTNGGDLTYDPNDTTNGKMFDW